MRISDWSSDVCSSDLGARADRIAHDVDLTVRGDETQHSLQDADMRLAACHDNIAALQNLFEKAYFPAHIECLLADHWAIPDRQVLHRRPKALRVLLREEPLDVEQLRRFNQASGVSDCRLAVEIGRAHV